MAELRATNRGGTGGRRQKVRREKERERESERKGTKWGRGKGFA